MKIMELLKSTKGKVIAGVLGLVLILGSGFAVLSMDKASDKKDDKEIAKVEEEKEADNQDENSDSTDSSSEAQNEESSSNSADSSKTASKSNTDSSSTSKSSSSSSSSVASSKSSSSSSSSSGSSSPAPKKEKKWVVDKAAWTETVKVPVTKYRKVYWGKLDNGELIYSENKREIVNKYNNGDLQSWGGPKKEAYTDYETKTINHPEKGHWE